MGRGGEALGICLLKKLSILILVKLLLAGVSASPCCMTHTNCHFQHVTQGGHHENTFTRTFGWQLAASNTQIQISWKGGKGGLGGRQVTQKEGQEGLGFGGEGAMIAV